MTVDFFNLFETNILMIEINVNTEYFKHKFNKQIMCESLNVNNCEFRSKFNSEYDFIATFKSLISIYDKSMNNIFHIFAFLDFNKFKRDKIL